ncbi:hypothetical protein [Novosphingobium naphthalenivorans]|uniref:hypothetical protein n=1 Tax=Novosphingobium naphthalenivorans TaxID=273168 RepID=UPI0012ECC430|nr:hypothetical protein [Novosphingobium naphthalenivorans]
MIASVSFPKFAAGWLPMLAVTAAVDPVPRLADAFAFRLGGFIVPPVTCVLGLLGVVMARPLVRKQEQALGLPLFLLVSAILLIMVELWILDSRPGALFAFVIAIGVGFSGYSLIELAGGQVKDMARRVLARGSADGGDV